MPDPDEQLEYRSFKFRYDPMNAFGLQNIVAQGAKARRLKL